MFLGKNPLRPLSHSSQFKIHPLEPLEAFLFKIYPLEEFLDQDLSDRGSFSSKFANL